MRQHIPDLHSVMTDDTGASMAVPASAAVADVSTATSVREGVVTGIEHASDAIRETAEEDTATRTGETT